MRVFYNAIEVTDEDDSKVQVVLSHYAQVFASRSLVRLRTYPREYYILRRR